METHQKFKMDEYDGVGFLIRMIEYDAGAPLTKKEKRAEYMHRWYAKNRKRVRISLNKWREEHPQKMAGYKEKWRKKNKDRICAYNKQYYQTEKGYKQMTYSNNKWRNKNPELMRLRSKAKSIRLSSWWQNKLKRMNGFCPSCKKIKDDLEMDHIIPLANGGTNARSNLQILCHRCNMRKGNSVKRFMCLWEV